MRNNPVQDAYNPPPINSSDFEETKFGEIDVNELFWLKTEKNDNNAAIRKINMTQGQDTKNRVIVTFSDKAKVFLKI